MHYLSSPKSNRSLTNTVSFRTRICVNSAAAGTHLAITFGPTAMQYATIIPAHYTARTRVIGRSPDGDSAVVSIDGYEFRIDRDRESGALDVFEPGTSETHHLSITPPREDHLIPESIALDSWGHVASRLPSPLASSRAVMKHESALRDLVATVRAIVGELGVFRSV